MLKLVLDLSGLLEALIVIDAEHASRQIRVEEKATSLWREKSRPRVACGHEGGESLVIGQVEFEGRAVELRFLPRYRKRDRSIQQGVEVIRVVCFLVEVIEVQNDVLNWVRVPACSGKLLVSPNVPFARPPAPVALERMRFSL